MDEMRIDKIIIDTNIMNSFSVTIEVGLGELHLNGVIVRWSKDGIWHIEMPYHWNPEVGHIQAISFSSINGEISIRRLIEEWLAKNPIFAEYIKNEEKDPKSA